MNEETPSIAIIVATYNRGSDLRLTLAGLCNQLIPSAEVWVIDQSEPDVSAANRAFVAKLDDPRFHWRHQPPSLPKARNAGIACSRAPIVWFIDDDVRLSDGCLQGHLDAYEDPRIGGVVGAITEQSMRPNAPTTTNRVGRGGRIYTNLEGSAAQRIQTLKGCNMSYRRQALEQAGGFDPGFMGTAFLEDADLSTRVRRLGWWLRFQPGAHLTHLSTPRGGVRVGSALATEHWRFHNTGRFVRKHRSPWTWPLVAGTFAGIAVKRAIEWRSPKAPLRLMGALVRGVIHGGELA